MRPFDALDFRTLALALIVLALACAPGWGQAAVDPSRAVVEQALKMKIDKYMRVGAAKTRKHDGKEVSCSDVRFLQKHGYQFDDLISFCKNIESSNSAIRITRFDFGKCDQSPDRWWRPNSMTVTAHAQLRSVLQTLRAFEKVVSASQAEAPSLRVDRLVVESNRVKWNMSLDKEHYVIVMDAFLVSADEAELIESCKLGDVTTSGGRVTLTSCEMKLKEQPKATKPNATIPNASARVLKAFRAGGATISSYRLDKGVATAEVLGNDADTLMDAIDAARRAAGADAVTIKNWSRTLAGGRTCTVSFKVK